MSTTNLDFLKVNGLYPPSTELERLARYKRYDDLFYSRIGEAYSSFIDKTTGGDMIDKLKTIFSNPKIMNYARAITKKTVDLALSNKPYVISNKSDNSLDLLEMQQATSIWKKTRQSLTDVSRYGNGYIREYNKIPRYTSIDKLGRVKLTEGEPACNAVNPSMVTEVVNPLDREDIQYFVIGWVDKIERNTDTQYEIAGTPQSIIGMIQYDYFLTVEIHEKGQYEMKRFRVGAPLLNYGSVKQYKIIEEVTSAAIKGKKFSTGLDGFAIKKLIGYTTTDNPSEGLSDYDMLDTLMIELMQRVSQLSQVFTKHGDPAMQGSADLLSTDENGNPVFYTGDFYPIKQGETPLSYITWDSQSKSILEYCNQILQNIWILTEMGDGTIMGYSQNTNTFADSGKALRMRLTSPLMKVQGLLIDNQDTIISIFIDFAKILGKKISRGDIEIRWQDGLPKDELEDANIFQMRVAAGTESVIYGLQRRYNMTPKQAEDEFEQILREKKMSIEATQKEENDENNLPNDKKSANGKSEIKNREQIERQQNAKISGREKTQK